MEIKISNLTTLSKRLDPKGRKLCFTHLQILDDLRDIDNIGVS